MDTLKEKIRHVPDFPKAGILFYDITTLLQDPIGFRTAIDSLALPFKDQGMAVRKPGKLPSQTVRCTYDLEYGTDCLEIHDDAVRKGQRVLIVDDLLATGGTARATVHLVKQLGGQVHALAFLIELVALNGRAKLEGETVHSVLKY
jgi:adenine phosphoribosyltransferase